MKTRNDSKQKRRALLASKDLFVATSVFNDGFQMVDNETDELALRRECKQPAEDISHSGETDKHDHNAA